MKICIVDDDISIVNILKDIITDHLKDVSIYTAKSGTEALELFDDICPDILLLDYLMPDFDGIQVLRKMDVECMPEVIMISEVSDKQMIAKAYDEAISFFINKPINVIEVISVLNRVIEYRTLRNTFSRFEDVMKSIKVSGSISRPSTSDEDKLKSLFSRLGIVGSSGCDELIAAVKWAKDQQNDYVLMDLYKYLAEDEDERNIHAVKKRIRRAITKAFKAMAALGIEDNLNPVYEDYAMRLFDYGELRKEMTYQQGKGVVPGKINIRQFIEASIVLIQD